MWIKIKQKKFDDLEIFSNVNLLLKSGIYILKGRNGIGKSTLFNIIYREDEEFLGEITYNDKNIFLYDKEYYRNNICTFFTQTNEFFNNLTVEEILKMFYGNSKYKNIEELLEKLNLKDKKKCEYHKLSGGEKQKVRLIIALTSNSKILLLDEPENNLDHKSIEFILEYLKKEKKIIIISSHTVEENIAEFNYLNIIDRNIEVKKSKSNNIEVTNNEIEKDIHMTKGLSNKIVSKINKNLRVTVVAISLIILIFSITLALSFDELEFTTRQTGNLYKQDFKNNSTVIYPPMSNQYFFKFGTNEWLEKHSSYFSENDYLKLKEINYVTKVEPINLYTMKLESDYTDDNYILGPVIDYDKLDYTKYNMEKYQLDTVSETVKCNTLLSKKDIAENIPVDYQGNIDSLVYGEFPEDSTNQVMIDIYLAMYVAEEESLDTLDDLINTKISLPAMKVDDYNMEYSDYGEDVDDYKEYVVSGIYIPEEIPNFSSRIFTAYDENSPTVKYNNYFLANNEDLEISSYQMAYNDAKNNYSSIGREFESFDEFKEEFPDNKIYNGFYIEVEDEKNLKDLTNTIMDYDKYIEINNNYTFKNTNRYNFKFLKKSIMKQVLKVTLLFILFIIILIFMNKFYQYQNKKKIDLLKFYGFSINDLKRIKKNAYFKLGIFNLTIIIVLNLILINTHFKGLTKYLNLIYIFVFILIFIFYKKSLRRINADNIKRINPKK